MSGNMVLASQFNRPTVSKRVISLSPLARLFRPYSSIGPYLDNPLAWKDDKSPFDVVIEGSWNTKVLRSGEIHLLDESLTSVFVGIDNTRLNREYASTGLVYFEVGEEITAALEYTTKTKRPLPDDLKADVLKATEEFRELSHQRVLSHCRDLYNTLKSSRDQLRASGKEPLEPNDMELVIAFILKDEVEAAKRRRAKLSALWDETTKEIGADADKMF